MNQTEITNLLNHASRQELIAIPGIGSALADRLMASRPFDSIESIRAVKGIGTKLLDNLMNTPVSQPDPTPVPLSPSGVSSASDQTSLEEKTLENKESLSEMGENSYERSKVARDTIGENPSNFGENIREGVARLGEAASERGQATRKALKALQDQFDQAAESRGPLWTNLINSAATALVAILLTLAVLGSINGSLKYATGSQYRIMQREAAQLATQVNALQQDLDGLRGRIDALEGLGERTVALEKAQQQLVSDLGTASQQVADMQVKVTALDKKVDQQEERTQRFETFLQELQTLLSNLFAPQGGSE